MKYLFWYSAAAATAASVGCRNVYSAADRVETDGGTAMHRVRLCSFYADFDHRQSVRTRHCGASVLSTVVLLQRAYNVDLIQQGCL